MDLEDYRQLALAYRELLQTELALACGSQEGARRTMILMDEMAKKMATEQKDSKFQNGTNHKEKNGN
ncbi:MAG: hypothetical protein GY861_03720 [bacterium]|nr:hypothetical protein [bacterium]